MPDTNDIYHYHKRVTDADASINDADIKNFDVNGTFKRSQDCQIVDTNAAFSSSLIVETEKGKTNVEVGDDKIVERIVNVDSDTSLDDLRDMMLTDEESEEEMREGSALEEDVSMTQDDSIFTEEPTDTDEEYIEDEDEVWNDQPRKQVKKQTRMTLDSSEAEEELWGRPLSKKKKKPRNKNKSRQIIKSKPEEYAVSDSEAKATDSDGEQFAQNRLAKESYEIPFIRQEDVEPIVERILKKRVASNGHDLEYFIKWKEKSHCANTWETVERIVALGGDRKLANYLSEPIQTSDDEDFDWEEFKVIERIIDDYKPTIDDEGALESDSEEYYLCKWMNQSYRECTWESRSRLLPQYTFLVDEYVARLQSGGISTCPKGFYRRCQFHRLLTVPDYLKQAGTLRDYQLEGINWLLYSWCHGNNVILADEMGLGKTIQTVSFISALYHEYGFTGPVLVVVPLSTIAAWQKEFAHWAPALTTLLYMGDGKSRGIQRFYEWFALEEDKVDSDIRTLSQRQANKGPRPLFHVLLTTYELILKDKEHLAQVDWRMLIVDEGHRLKNASSQLHSVLDELSPTSRLLVTGTPLQNSMLELWSLLHFLMPNKFPDYEEFLAKYGPPTTVSDRIDDQHNTADLRLEKLHRIIKPHLLRRMKKDVEASLPSKTERILRVELSPKQKELLRLIITKNYRELVYNFKAIGSLNNILMELKKVCNHPLLVTAPTEEEAISLDILLRESGKMALLDQLLGMLRKGGHRVLIFSQMVRMLDLLQVYLKLRNWKFQRLDGSTTAEQRKRSISSFNARDSEDFCFLLSTKAGGLGINLETADTVIIYDSDWNPQNDLQAMARAHRIGQTRSVNIYRLVSKGSVEETILERAKRKMVLEHLVIHSMDTTSHNLGSQKSATMEGKKIDREELQAILKFGAQDLFKEDSGTTGPTVNLEEILARADDATTASMMPSAGSQFFDQFKVADFSSIAWDQILPAEEVTKAQMAMAEEDEQKKEMVLQEAILTTATKRKRTIPMTASLNHNNNNTNKSKGVAARGKRVEPISKLSENSPKSMQHDVDDEDDMLRITKSVTRALIGAVLRFGLLEDRFSVIWEYVKQAEGKSFRKDLLFHALMVLKRKMSDPMMKDHCKLSNLVHVNLSQLRDRHRYLNFLHDRIKSYEVDEKLNEFTITEQGIKSVATVGAHRWLVPWTSPQDDARLLVGIYKHGWGEWLAIARDSELGLEKLQESLVMRADDASFLPKELHLNRRAENVVQHMIADKPNVGGRGPGGGSGSGSRSRDESGGSKGQSKQSEDIIITTENQDDDEQAECLTTIENKNEDDDNDKQLKVWLKPVRKDLAFLASLTADTFSDNLDRVCDALYRIGQYISNQLKGERLWKTVATLWPTEITGRELKHFYSRIRKEREG